MSHLYEAWLMQQHCNERPGNTIAGIEYLDSHPEHRILLENLLQSRGGALYEDTPNYTGGDSLPIHLSRERTFYLRHTKCFEGAQTLLTAMKSLYGTPGPSTTAGLKEARRWFLKKAKVLDDPCKALVAMTEYFEGLVGQLPELDGFYGMTELEDEVIEDDPRPTDLANFRVGPSNNEDEHEVQYSCSNLLRQELIHMPGSAKKDDWVTRQPKAWRQLFFGTRKADSLKKLPRYCAAIRKHQEDKTMTKAQINVLWSAYLTRRDYLRQRQISHTSQILGEYATKLIEAVNRQTEIKKLGRMGAAFFNWSKGEAFNGRKLPKPVTKEEWAVIWNAYNAHKAQLK